MRNNGDEIEKTVFGYKNLIEKLIKKNGLNEVSEWAIKTIVYALFLEGEGVNTCETAIDENDVIGETLFDYSSEIEYVLTNLGIDYIMGQNDLKLHNKYFVIKKNQVRKLKLEEIFATI